jgi:ectoine utilization protein EutC
MLLFTEEEMRQHVQLNQDVISVVEEGFTNITKNNVEMPPIMRIDIPDNNGEVDLKSAYIRGYGMFAIKVSSGFFNNINLGLPSGNGLMILVSTETGIPQALLLDNGYLTDIRTAAAGAIAAKYLARENIETAGVIGAGSQARYQMIALKKVRDFKRILVYGRTPHRVEQFAKEMKHKLGVEVIAANSPERVVKESDVVVTTTPAKTPIIRPEWLHPGLHITAMGSDAETKQELDAGVFERADHVVCDVKSQCFRLGELHHALDQGVIHEDSLITELGELTYRRASGRKHDQQITVCDLTGTGAQDTAIALYTYKKMTKTGAGIKVDNKKITSE